MSRRTMWNSTSEDSEHGKRYALADIRNGAILMSVEARSAADASEIAAEWRNSGGRDIHRMTAT